MNRNKTQRRRTTEPATGPFLGDNTAKSTENSLEAFFVAEAATFKQPWQKLDRGSRLDRLRKFVQAYEEAKPLTPAERASLLTAILQAFELRQLNSKLAVDYDADTGGLSRHRIAIDLSTTNGYPDGCTIDTDGNLWIASAPGVQIWTPQGQRIGMIRTPEASGNVCFGGPKRNRLFMAASQSLYAVYVGTQGAGPA